MAITRILDISLVKLPQGIDLPPPGPTIPLSFLDIWWVATPPVKYLFLYHDFSLSSFESLKSSLYTTLPFFHLLAGELALFPPSSFSISCTSETGVKFIEAESDIVVRAFARDPILDMESYNQLLPSIKPEGLPLPIFAVQVTKFVNGGIAIGITMHHTVMDGIGITRFINTWCAVHQGKKLVDVIGQVMPVHDRAVIAIKGHEEISRRFANFFAPMLPSVSRRRSDDTLENHLDIIRKRFVLNEVSIQSLKRQVVEKTSTSIPLPSTFQVVIAYLWTCVAKTKGLSCNNELTHLCFVSDCRSILNLPVPSAYTGNCLHGTYVDLMGSILASTDGLVQATIATARAVRRAKSEPLKGIEGVPEGLKVFVSGILRYYDADFGWGRPERVETIMENNGEAQAIIYAGKEKGTVQVSLVLPKCDMEKFSDVFMKGLDVATYSKL
ncbi:hypothetical protein LUZ60_002494 [Juncus effusus]|nr:hypothetical protein LUZ60_002494 [Juncus effusus]